MYKYSDKDHKTVTNRTTGASGIHPGVWQWEAYKKWQEEGGITEAFDTRTPEEILADEQKELVSSIESAIDTYIDTIAKEKGYGTATMSPTAAIMTYVGYPNIYQEEALAFGQWKASVWPKVHTIYTEVLQGIRPVPTAQEMIAELDPMIWPEGGSL